MNMDEVVVRKGDIFLVALASTLQNREYAKYSSTECTMAAIKITEEILTALNKKMN